MTQNTKSVITCDMEGRIETFNKGAEELFGYRAEDIIGKKRVSLFSPGHTVLEHVPSWLRIASQEGEFTTKTIFLRHDGNPFPAQIRITPTFKHGQQIGFCGVTEPLENVDPDEIAPSISTKTKLFSWMVITRAPFLTAIVVPILFSAAWVAYNKLAVPFPGGLFLLVLFAGVFTHIAANTFNDYFDWTSGTDPANNNYFTPYTGGSRSIELGLISEKSLFIVASISLLIAGMLGLALAFFSGFGVLLFGLVGAFSAFFYTAPPLRLAARRGLGELLVGLNFGPLATGGAIYALTGNVTAIDFLVGIPIGLLTTAILWINQFPDVTSDRDTGKINLVVLLGRKRARWGYILLISAAFGLSLFWMLNGVFPIGVLLTLGSLPIAINACRVVMHEYNQRTLVRASAATIQLHMVVGLLLAIGLVLSIPINRFFGL